MPPCVSDKFKCPETGCERTFRNAHSMNAHRRVHVNGASSAPRRARKRVALERQEADVDDSASDSNNGDLAVDGESDEKVDGEPDEYFDAAEAEGAEPDGLPPCDVGAGAAPPRVISGFIPDFSKASHKFANRSAPLAFARLQKLEAEEPEVVKTASLVHNAGLTRASKQARVCVNRLI